MPTTRLVHLHGNHEIVDGRPLAALWPAHKPLKEVLALRDTTPEQNFEATYQGNPTPPGGATFKREWWRGKNRYRADDPDIRLHTIFRVLSYDTAFKDTQTSDYTGSAILAMLADYRLCVMSATQARIEFPDLPDEILRASRLARHDDKLKAVIIEDTGAGTSSLQTLRASQKDRWLARILVPFGPRVSKVERANQASIWCKNGSVLLPEPSPEVPWLDAFETQLFTFPSGEHDDMVDALTQGIIYLKHYLAQGYHARAGLAERSRT